MTLGQKRRKFTHMIALLITHVEYLGYGVAGDFLKRCEDCTIGKKDSAHKVGLAIDLNLYNSQGKYLSDGIEAEVAHNKLHNYWDAMGGAKRIPYDLNHYSLEHQGMR